MLFVGSFRLLRWVVKILTYFHIVFVSSGCLVGFVCFKLCSFVVTGADLSQVVVGCWVLDILRLLTFLRLFLGGSCCSFFFYAF